MHVHRLPRRGAATGAATGPDAESDINQTGFVGGRLAAGAARTRRPRRPPPCPAAARPSGRMGDSPSSSKASLSPKDWDARVTFTETGLPVELPCNAPSYLAQRGALPAGPGHRRCRHRCRRHRVRCAVLLTDHQARRQCASGNAPRRSFARAHFLASELIRRHCTPWHCSGMPSAVCMAGCLSQVSGGH